MMGSANSVRAVACRMFVSFSWLITVDCCSLLEQWRPGQWQASFDLLIVILCVGILGSRSPNFAMCWSSVDVCQH